MLYACHVLYCVSTISVYSILQLGGLGHAPRKFLKIKSYKIESGGNFNPTIMVIAKNAHYPGKVEIDCENNLIAKLLC